MGFINKAKAGAAEQGAQHAIDRGRNVFVFKFIEAMTNSMATGPMTGLNDQIEAIESLGWRLDQLAVGEGKAMTGERIAVVCLFRRTWPQPGPQNFQGRAAPPGPSGARP